jgi:GDP-4-dehydro-6-deoxy-D-mannose reductase
VDSAQVEYHSLDVTKLAQCSDLFANYRPEVVYHLAGVAFAPNAERDFAVALSVNVLGTYNILRACADLGQPCRVLVISSAEVYQRVEQEDLPLTEEHAVFPLHNYGLSKLLAENVVQRFSSYDLLKTVVVRAFNHIGAGQKPDFVVSNFARQLAEIAKGKTEAVIRVGNLNARRDFSDVRDIVRGYRLVAMNGSGMYNLGSGQAVSIAEMLAMLIEISGLKVDVCEDPERMRRLEVPVVYGSYCRAEKELGWKPKFSLRESLEEVYQYWLEH